MGLRFEPSLPYARWAPVGGELRRFKDWVQFGIGDWLNHGEAAYGETYAQAASETGIQEETLMVLKSIAGAVPLDIRRIDKLHWSHHRLVAPKKYPSEEKVKWLERAIKGEWTVKQMAEKMNPKLAAAKEEGDETETIRGGCETCGETPAAMKSCGKCASVAAAAIENGGIKEAIRLLKAKPSKPQSEILRWAFDYIQEPESAPEDWRGRYLALKKMIDKAA